MHPEGWGEDQRALNHHEEAGEEGERDGGGGGHKDAAQGQGWEEA